MKRFLSIISLFFLVCAGAGAFDIRGINIDFRTQVMTMDALRSTVAEASAEGINTLLIEWEGSFPFEENAALRNKYAFSRKEISDFVVWCNSIGVDVIPIQNCFGHCEYILTQPRYAALREVRSETSQICPMKEDRCAEVFRSIFSEVAALHTSRYIHIGADETMLLGRCKACAAKVEKEGISALYVDYVVRMCEIIHSLGRTPVIWADMLLKYPEAAERLPRDLVVLDWNYGWTPDHFGDIDPIRELGFEVWGAPALRSHPDNLYLVQWYKHFNNLAVYPKYALEHGYTGLIETSWSTSGTYAPTLDASYDVYSLQPIREVYPLSAFGPLQRAFAKVVNNPEEDFDADSFLASYAEDHFGIETDEGKERFVAYFNMKQEPCSGTGAKFKESALLDALSECRTMLKEFKTLRPRKNRKDFAHLVLMLEIRENYLSFMLERCRYSSEDYRPSSGSEVTSALRKVVKKGHSLRRRFCRLNKGYLKDPAASYGRSSYLGAAEELLEVIKR